MRVGTEGDTKSARKSKIGQLEVSFLVDEEVLGLEVAVKDAVRVEVVNSSDELVRLQQHWCQV